TFQSHQSDMIQVGVVVQNEEGCCYDRFRDRLIFPIRDRLGRYIGLGGRVFDDSKPKYLNSPETPLFHKGKELYGLYELKQVCREIPLILMVEGYMDVVSLAQFEVPYAVASLGTATTSDQIQLLFRHTKQIVCCYDGDQAGKTAAWRSLTTALPHLKAGQMLKFMFLPDQHDPDSYIRAYGKLDFEAQIRAALSLPDFLMQTLKRDNPDDKAAFVQQAITLAEQVNDEILQGILLDQVAYQVRLNSAAELKKKFNLKQRTSHAPMRAQTTDRQHYTMRLAIALLLQTPNLGYQLPKQTVLSYLKIRGGSLLAQLLDLTRDRHINTGQLIEHFRDQPKVRQIVIALSKWHTGVELASVGCEFKSSLIWLNNKYLEQQFNELNQKKALTTDERQQLQALVQALQRA
ncbi:MAG: toprim domain-containing protein, partial [Shewanellaceae bacterium]|nr:toprim domain-containing protein [Shewanellaceae bacterium]